MIAWLRAAGGRACIPASHEAVTTGETVLGRLPSPRYEQTEDTPSLSEKEAHLLVQELWPEERAFVPAHF